MASNIEGIKSDLARDELKLNIELGRIESEKQAITQQEKNLGSRLTEINNLKNNSDKAAKLADAKTDCQALADTKSSLYNDQLAAKTEAKRIQNQNALINQIEKDNFESEIEQLKADVEEAEKDLERLNDSKAAANNGAEDPHAIARERAIENKKTDLDQKKTSLDEKKVESETANAAADEQSTKDANAVVQSCPDKCSASKMTAWGDPGRNMKLEVTNGIKKLDVISLSKQAVDKGLTTPALEIISIALEGECTKGKLSVSPDSANHAELVRDEEASACPVALVKNGPTQIAMPGTQSGPMKFGAFCPDPPGGTFSDWKYVFENVLMPWKAKCNTYIVESKGCDGAYPLSVKINSYPQIKAGIEIGITYNYAKSEEDLPKLKNDGGQGAVTVAANADGSNGKKTIHVDSWEITVDLKGNVDHINLAQQLKYLDPSELLKGMREGISIFLLFFDTVFLSNESDLGANLEEVLYGGKQVLGDEESEADKKAKDSTGKTWDRQGSGATGKIAIKYPKLALAVGYENTETSRSDELDYKMAVELKADPLIGVEFQVDILSALIKIGMNSLLPGSSTALEAGKKFVNYIWPIIENVSPTGLPGEATPEKIEDRSYYIEGGISLVLKLGANLSCAGKWEKDFGQPQGAPTSEQQTGNTSASATTSLDFILEGKVYAKGKVLSLEFEAGFIVVLGSAKDPGPAKIEFKADLITEDNRPTVTGGIEWTGLAVLFMSYKDVKYKSANDSGRAEDGTDPEDYEEDEEDEEDSTIETGASNKKYKNSWIIIEPGKFPEKPQVPFDEYTTL